jgi:hypothetical protein
MTRDGTGPSGPAGPGPKPPEPPTPRPRVAAGRVNGVHAPVGTLLGPKAVTREYVVVTGEDERGVTVGYATAADIAAAGEVDPRSVTEARLRLAGQRGQRHIRI